MSQPTRAELKHSYQLLEVEETATLETVQESWKLLCRAWHPDRFHSQKDKDAATARLAKINAAHDVLEKHLQHKQPSGAGKNVQSPAKTEQPLDKTNLPHKADHTQGWIVRNKIEGHTHCTYEKHENFLAIFDSPLHAIASQQEGLGENVAFAKLEGEICWDFCAYGSAARRVIWWTKVPEKTMLQFIHNMMVDASKLIVELGGKRVSEVEALLEVRQNWLSGTASKDDVEEARRKVVKYYWDHVKEFSSSNMNVDLIPADERQSTLTRYALGYLIHAGIHSGTTLQEMQNSLRDYVMSALTYAHLLKEQGTELIERLVKKLLEARPDFNSKDIIKYYVMSSHIKKCYGDKLIAIVMEAACKESFRPKDYICRS